MEFGLQKLYEQHLLEEGRRNRYYSMFKGVESNDEIERIVNQAVQWFKREDRIIWYLRWYKLVLINHKQNYYEGDKSYAELFTPDEKIQYQKQLEWKKQFYQYVLKHNKSYGDQPLGIPLEEYFEFFGGSNINTVESNMRHFLSLPIEKIQNYQFEWQTPSIIFQHFTKLEREWRKKQKEDSQWIDITDELGDGIEIVHKFDDGFYWLDLKKEYCDLEGKAMGHCGNSADHQDGDTVLSLRKLKKVKGQILSRPSLTFILRDGGLLGEMKGRENNKPHEKYHPHILTLLKIKKNGQFLVQGIVGGGYLSESNFSLNDLSTEDLQRLYKIRPELRPLRDIYAEDGLTEDLIKKISSIKDFKSIDREAERVLFLAFDSLDTMFNTFSSPSRDEFYLKNYLPYITGEEYFEFNNDSRNDGETLKDLYTTVLYKKPELKEKFKAYIFLNYGNDAKEYDMEEGSLDAAPNQFDFLNERDDDVISLLDNAIDDGIRTGSEGEMYDAFKKGLQNLSVMSHDENYNFGFKYSNDYGDGPIYYNLTIPEALDVYDELKSGNYSDIRELLNGDDYDGASFDGDMIEPRYGFYGYDEKYAVERFQELLDENNILNNTEVVKLESTEKYLNFF